jgi:hypothetical protein
VNSDGHWDPVAFSPKELKVKTVFILVDDEKRKIWIWIGKGAAVKTRFISSTAATEIRRLYGLTFRVQTVDQGEEAKEFVECIESIPKKGLVPELAEGQTKRKSTKSTSTRKKRTTRTKKAPSTAKKTSTAKTKSKSTRKTPARKTSPKKTTTKTTRKPTKTKTKGVTPKPLSSRDINPVDGYIPQNASVITTPSCPECGVGNLLPYSEKMEQEGRDNVILPFAKWICSKCDYSPNHQ